MRHTTETLIVIAGIALCAWSEIPARSAFAAADDVESPVKLTYRVLRRISLGSHGAEIGAYSTENDRLAVVGAGGAAAISLSTARIKRETIAGPANSIANSVAAHNGYFAIAWASADKTQPGAVWLYDADSLKNSAVYPAGYHPDMTTFSDDGQFLLVANEGEPTDDYLNDPEGSVTLVDLSTGIESAAVNQLRFCSFNDQRDALRARGVRISGPSSSRSDCQATVAQDLEPEYIAVSSDSRRAWVTLQENNAVAEIDLQKAKVTAIHPLGEKNFRRIDPPAKSTGLDPSDRDAGAQIGHWPVFGLLQPDAVASFEVAGVDFLVTANEGDVREYGSYRDYCRAEEIANWDVGARARRLTGDHQLGRLAVCPDAGDVDNDGDLDRLVAFGTRSFAVWRAAPGELKLLFESGNDFERLTATLAPDRFNSSGNAAGLADERSPVRGPEPEGVAVGMVDGRRLAFISLERPGGAMVYDLSDPASPQFVAYIPPIDDGKLCDCGPEGLHFVSKKASPVGKPLLMICNEVSGTISIYELGSSATSKAGR